MEYHVFLGEYTDESAMKLHRPLVAVYVPGLKTTDKGSDLSTLITTNDSPCVLAHALCSMHNHYFKHQKGVDIIPPIDPDLHLPSRNAFRIEDRGEIITIRSARSLLNDERADFLDSFDYWSNIVQTKEELEAEAILREAARRRR